MNFKLSIDTCFINDWLKILIQDQPLDNIIRELQEQANSNGLISELLDEILLG
jgi:hypothetical protein